MGTKPTVLGYFDIVYLNWRSRYSYYGSAWIATKQMSRADKRVLGYAIIASTFIIILVCLSFVAGVAVVFGAFAGALILVSIIWVGLKLIYAA